MRTNRSIRVGITKDGSQIAQVPIGPSGAESVTMDKQDYDHLIELGVSGNWSSINGYAVCNSRIGKPRKLLVARVLVDAKAGEIVRYKDGNKRNLRRDNLSVEKAAHTKRRDRDFLSYCLRDEGGADDASRQGTV